MTGGHPYDVAILGGGMAGMTAALQARRRDAKVVLFEPGPMGGT
jgi:thioredoxin reductase